MMTFITDRNWYESAMNLDNRRLPNQLFECKFVLGYLVDGWSGRWKNSPLLPMWRGHEYHLISYTDGVHQACRDRGFNVDRYWRDIEQIIHEPMNDMDLMIKTAVEPLWMKDDKTFNRLISTHRARLYQKRPDLYPQWKDEPHDVCHPGRCNYLWPSHLETQ